MGFRTRFGLGLLLIVAGLLAACGAGAEPAAQAPTAGTVPEGRATAAPQPATVAPTDQGSQASTAAPAGAAAPTIPQSVTPEGYQVLGAADAPVTIEHYSDFL